MADPFPERVTLVSGTVTARLFVREQNELAGWMLASPEVQAMDLAAAKYDALVHAGREDAAMDAAATWRKAVASVRLLILAKIDEIIARRSQASP